MRAGLTRLTLAMLASPFFVSFAWSQSTTWQDAMREVVGDDQMPVPICSIMPEFCIPGDSAFLSSNIELELINSPDAEPLQMRSSKVPLEQLGLDQNASSNVVIELPENAFVGLGGVWIPNIDMEIAAVRPPIDDQDIVPICSVLPVCEADQDPLIKFPPDFDLDQIQLQQIKDLEIIEDSLVGIPLSDVHVGEGFLALVPSKQDWMVFEKSQ